MEFHEKLAELRKSKGLTQEELAGELFVSRTAISRWESGRGYPSIDSLKEISRYFSVTIDELICPKEMITAAEDDQKAIIGRYVSVICNTLDILTVVLLFLPLFGNGSASCSVRYTALAEDHFRGSDRSRYTERYCRGDPCPL